jgi:hypothetical protein
VGDEMHNIAFTLDASVDANHSGGQNDAPISLEHLYPHHQIGDAGFVLDRDEHDAFGGAGPLSDEDQAGYLRPCSVARLHRFSAAHDASAMKIRAKEGDRMTAER